MTKRTAPSLALSLLLLAATAVPALAQAAPPVRGAAYKPPRTSWGDPDLRGIWPLDAAGNTPLQRPEQFGTRAMLTDEEYEAAEKRALAALKAADTEQNSNKLGAALFTERGHALRQTSLIVEPANGRIPELTVSGKARAAAMHSSWDQKVFDGLDDFNSLDRCITRGLPASMIPFPYNNGVRIFQSPGFVTIQMELIHETRIIPLDGRKHIAPSMQTWLGDSRGHFEGNTLVVETTNFNGKSPMVIVGPASKPIPTSTAMKIVERLTPTGPDTIQYEAAVSDPETLTGPFKIAYPWTRNDKYQMFEYGCHEGNTTIRGYIRATSPRFAAYREAALKKK